MIRMEDYLARQVTIQDSFWTGRLRACEKSIFHQWQQLEASGCIDNFRIAAGEKEGFREGWFFADSDAYKWLEAAARVYTLKPSEEIKGLMEVFIQLVARVQMGDGYIFTYNQIHFPGTRWENLMIEHELYCHGHLIEAGISHWEATGEDTALAISCKAGDLLVREFLTASPEKTSGHEEIEIALLRLYQVTGQEAYLELARAFLERRGKVRPFALLMLRQNAAWRKRASFVVRQRQDYLDTHSEHRSFRLPPDNMAKKPWNTALRWQLSGLTGQYMQQHLPIRRQTVPVGHAVRFTYLETATALLSRLTGDKSLLPAMEQAWERMVTRRMYITGGLGSVPGLEGFGRDYELDPEYAYAETCAALGSLFWNREMGLLTSRACYSDLAEWQLYNAALVGMGLEGDSYLYNNPLACRGGILRRPWFRVPCCPSNLTRTLAYLGTYIYSLEGNDLWINQYIGSRLVIEDKGWAIRMESGLPWDGKVRIEMKSKNPVESTLHLRVPSWAGKVSLRINDQPVDVNTAAPLPKEGGSASGYDPRQSWFLPVHRAWQPFDVVELKFEMPILLRRAAWRVRGHHGKIALTRGPVVYCLESVDNPGLDVFSLHIQPDSIRSEYCPELLGGIHVLRGKTVQDQPVTAIPYHLWANRGESQMVVWVDQ